MSSKISEPWMIRFTIKKKSNLHVFHELCTVLVNIKLICILLWNRWGFLGDQMVMTLPAMQEPQVWSLGWEDTLEKEWQPTPVLLPGEFHGQRSLAGYNPWGRKEWDTTVTNAYYLPNMFISYLGSAFCVPSSYSLVRWAGAEETDLA